ncbi:MAG: acylphosphatase [Methylovirgula sp.]
MDSAEKIVRVRVSGRVQGVGFRAFTLRHAEARGISGWVRNCRNGDVEAVFAGSEDAVAMLCELCRRGPPQAKVDRFEIFEADLSALAEAGGLPGFRQVATE